MKTLDQLLVMLKDLGLEVPQGKINKVEIEDTIRDHIWNRENPGKPLPRQISPMKLQTLADLSLGQQENIWSNPDWRASLKIDGIRCILQLGAGHESTNILTSRRRSDVNFRLRELQNNFPHIGNLSLPLLDGTVMDGELYLPEHSIDTGSTQTENQLQAIVALAIAAPEKAIEIQRKNDAFAYLMVFDMLFHEGKDIRSWKFKDRRESLEAVFSSYNFGQCINLEELVKENKKHFYTDAVSKGMEGIVLKNIHTPYTEKGRPPYWLKQKKELTFDGFISGWIESKEKGALRDYIGGFKVSACDRTGKEKVFACCTALPLDLRKQATVYENEKPTLNPEFLGKVVEIIGQDFSAKSSRLNHARINRFREDKPREDCVVPNLHPIAPTGDI